MKFIATGARKVYIAGPMTGKPDWNRPLFAEAEKELISRLGDDWEVINPATYMNGDWTYPKEVYMRGHIPVVADCDAVVTLDGWEKSVGACLEVMIAIACGRQVWSMSGIWTGRPLEQDEGGRKRLLDYMAVWHLGVKLDVKDDE